MYEDSEEEKEPLLDCSPESGGGRRKEGMTAVVKFEDEEDKTKNWPEEEEAAVESDEVDGIGKRKKKVIIPNPKPKPTIKDLQREVENVQGIMRDNIQNLVNERERRLENVLERAERVQNAAGDFARVTRRARVRVWLRSNKWAVRIICTAVVLILCAVVTAVIVLKTKGII
ncbi:uncharacterized protein LOC144882527 [Branchiostoma floridae x Branchiostoma japonicum]